MTSVSERIIRFEGFEIDPWRGELRKCGQIVPAEPQVLDLLAFLASEPGRVFSRSEIIDGVWGGRIVSDSAISTRINAVRVAVGDDGKSQRIIRTVPRRGFMFVPEVDIGQATATVSVVSSPLDQPASPKSSKPSIAVLPFENMSGDSEHTYFADGIAEDLIAALSKYRQLFISARDSTFGFRENEQLETRSVADQLGVSYVLRGCVRRHGSQVRIVSQLIEASEGNAVWAERYDREMSDYFDLQDELTRSIVSAVVPELTDAEHSRALRKPAGSMDAWELYHRGIWHSRRVNIKYP
ncbi:MAG: hypothetical protein GY798_04735 [Hyphomicrobiales bacterium]|nr:hypothetical protein [Hyphomicrobiales bacterium]